jgi:hypothetical protein
MLKAQRLSLLLGVSLGLFIVGSAFGQNYGGASATIGSITGYTSTNFTYMDTYPPYTAEYTTNGGLVHVSATFVRPFALALQSLRAQVTVPDGWSVDFDVNNITNGYAIGLFSYFAFPSSAGSSDGVTVTPLYDPLIPGSFLYEGSGWGTAPPTDKEIKLNFDMYVPAGDRGDKTLDIQWYYTPTALGFTTNLQSSDNGQIIADLNPPLKIGTVIFGR